MRKQNMIDERISSIMFFSCIYFAYGLTEGYCDLEAWKSCTWWDLEAWVLCNLKLRPKWMVARLRNLKSHPRA